MLRLLAAFIVLFSTSAFAQEAPVCGGESLLDKLEASDKAAYDAVMAEAGATPNGEAVFWRIEAPDVSEPSWLLGTAHVTDPRIHDLPAETEERLLKASVAIFELAEVVDKAALAGAMMRNARFMAMPIGQTIWDVIPDADEPAIRDNPALLPGQNKTLDAFQPWVVATMLSLPQCEAMRQQLGLVTFDEALAGKAQAAGIEVLGLETVEEQLGLFANLPMEAQAKYLVATAKNAALMPDYFETLIRFYVERKVAVLMPLSKRVDPDAGNKDSLELMAFFENDLIAKRNTRMAERARSYLDLGNAFIAVGALHLPGEGGVVELLKKAGYKVTPVN
jgi:uncharacterized protein